jgi:hypothetical protein
MQGIHAFIAGFKALYLFVGVLIAVPQTITCKLQFMFSIPCQAFVVVWTCPHVS